MAFHLGMISIAKLVSSKEHFIEILIKDTEMKFCINLLNHLKTLKIKSTGFYDVDLEIGDVNLSEEILNNLLKDEKILIDKEIITKNNIFWPITRTQLKTSTLFFESILGKPVKFKFAEIQADFVRSES